MKEIMISQFLDDELNLDEKIDFIETVHHDAAFKKETVDFLNLEKQIRTDAVLQVPDIDLKRPIQRSFWSKIHPLRFIGAGLVAAAAALILFLAVPQRTDLKSPYRFVLFQPEANQVEISGSFTDWKPIPMIKTGLSGYWEATLDLDPGEYRFNYIIEGRRRIPDPTIIIREKDDFGGINSILKVGTAI
jgi:hypothetical protein